MPDASPPAPSKAKLSAGTKAVKGTSADAASDNKKRFEVKKVNMVNLVLHAQ